MEILKKNIGGLPVGVWLLIIAAGVGAGIVLRKRGQSQADQAAQDSTDSTSTDAQDYSSVPYDSLASESSGYFPAYGPPTVPGSTQAVRLDPGTLRIRVVQPKHHHGHKGSHKGHGGSGQHGGGGKLHFTPQGVI